MENCTAVVIAANLKIGIERSHELAQNGCNLILVTNAPYLSDDCINDFKVRYDVAVFQIKSDPFKDGNPFEVASAIQDLDVDVTMFIDAAGRGIFGTSLQLMLTQYDAYFLNDVSRPENSSDVYQMQCRQNNREFLSS